MTETQLYLENIQGLLIYLKHENGQNVSLFELLEKERSEPNTYDFILDSYKQNHESTLQNYFKKKQSRLKLFYRASLLSTAHNLEIFNKNCSDEEFKNEITETDAFINNSILNLPTKFQELHSYITVAGLLDTLWDVVDVIGYEISSKPIIGTVSTNSVNACAITFKTRSSIIIIEEDMLALVHLFSKVFVQCLTIVNKTETVTSINAQKENIIREIATNSEILSRFRDLLEAYIFEGSPRKSEQYNLVKDARYQLCTELIYGIELFLVGHELGHIISNYDNSTSPDIEYFFFEGEDNWDKEYKADAIGMSLSMRAMANRGFEIDFCYLGIELFFIIHSITIRAKKILKDGNEGTVNDFYSHPPNSNRMENTRSILREMNLANDKFQNATFLPDIINEVTEILWDRSKDIFYQAYRKNIM